MKRLVLIIGLACVASLATGATKITDNTRSDIMDVNNDGSINARSVLPNTPTNFIAQTSNSRQFDIGKGQLNKLRLRPAILNEHIESSREIQAVCSSTQIVGQIFRASQDNINGLICTLESAAGSTVDNFESYADTAALRVVWTNRAGANQPILATVIVNEGTKSMLMSGATTVGSETYTTNNAVDYEDFTFGIDAYQTKQFGVSSTEFYIEDSSGYEKHLPLAVQGANSWNHFDFLESAMTEGQTNVTDVTDIVEVGFRLIVSSPTTEVYVDDISATPEPGSINLELWDMGTNLPVSGVTALSDGEKYTELGDRGLNGGGVATNVSVELIGGKRMYTARAFVAGPALEIPDNTLLNVSNYYAITWNYVDTAVDVFGPDTSFASNYYESGYAFTTPDTNTAITAIGTNSDCMFGIMSTQEAFLNTVVKFYDSLPGENATESVFIEDRNMRVATVIVGETRPQLVVEAFFRDTRPCISKGSKFEVYYNDDATDSVTKGTVLMGYLFAPAATFD